MMFNLGLITWMRIAACAVALALLGWSYWVVYDNGRASVLDQLKADRVTVLKDGKRVDDEVLDADTDTLCRLLGGCGMSNDSNRD